MTAAGPDRRSPDLLGRLRGARLGPPAATGDGARRDARASAWRPPSSARTASCPTTRRRRRPRSAAPACAPSAASCRSSCTTPPYDPVAEVDGALDGFVAAGRRTLVLAAATGLDGYDDRPVLDDAGWRTLLANLDRLARDAAERGVRADAAPARRHHGRAARDEVDRVLDGSAIGLCLDTGHLLIGGTDPVALARRAQRTGSRTRTSRTSTPRWAAQGPGRRGQLHRRRARRACTGRSAQGDVDVAAIVARAGGRRATTAGTSWSRTPSSTPAPAGEGRRRRAGQHRLPARRWREPAADVRAPGSTCSRWAGSASTSTRCRSACRWRTSRPSGKFLGGSATNVAVAAARHGRRSAA